jgi:hypothetical protein
MASIAAPITAITITERSCLFRDISVISVPSGIPPRPVWPPSTTGVTVTWVRQTQSAAVPHSTKDLPNFFAHIPCCIGGCSQARVAIGRPPQSANSNLLASPKECGSERFLAFSGNGPFAGLKCLTGM